jgi:hypothetical protein
MCKTGACVSDLRLREWQYNSTQLGPACPGLLPCSWTRAELCASAVQHEQVDICNALQPTFWSKDELISRYSMVHDASRSVVQPCLFVSV